MRYRLLGLLQVLDVATTWVILTLSSQHAEGNPVVGAVISSVGLGPAMVTLLAVKLGVVYLAYRNQIGVKLISAVYTAVLVNNLLALWMVLS